MHVRGSRGWGSRRAWNWGAGRRRLTPGWGRAQVTTATRTASASAAVGQDVLEKVVLFGWWIVTAGIVVGVEHFTCEIERLFDDAGVNGNGGRRRGAGGFGAFSETAAAAGRWGRCRLMLEVRVVVGMHTGGRGGAGELPHGSTSALRSLRVGITAAVQTLRRANVHFEVVGDTVPEGTRLLYRVRVLRSEELVEKVGYLVPGAGIASFRGKVAVGQTFNLLLRNPGKR